MSNGKLRVLWSLPMQASYSLHKSILIIITDTSGELAGLLLVYLPSLYYSAVVLALGSSAWLNKTIVCRVSSNSKGVSTFIRALLLLAAGSS